MAKGDKKKPAPRPNFPTREQIIQAYVTYGGRYPEEAEIQSHLGNPGGIDAVIKMLRGASGQGDMYEQPTPVPQENNQELYGSSTPKLIAENVTPIGMSYWRCINNHAGQTNLRVVITIDNSLHIFTINKQTLEVTNITDLHINDSGEQVYFSVNAPYWLFIRAEDRLYMRHIETGEEKVVMVPTPGMNLWQCHSSWDELTHSATLKDNSYRPIAWLVKTPYGYKQYLLHGEADECQVDKSGLFLVAKETRGSEGNKSEDNRIIQLSNDREYWITDAEGAVGHSDTGNGFMVGEDNQIGGCVKWQLGNPAGSKTVIYGPNIWNMGYVALSKGRVNDCLITLPSKLTLAKLDDSGQSRDICPTLTQTNEKDPKYYERRSKANWCPLGQFAIWSAYVNGQINVYMVRTPEW